MNELTRSEVKAAVERKGTPRIPMHKMNYFNDETVKKYGKERLNELHSRYPDDIITFSHGWNLKELADKAGCEDSMENKAIDSQIILKDYSNIDEFAVHIVAQSKKMDIEAARKVRDDHPGRYCMGYSWQAIYHKLWMLRGLENALMDFYDDPDGIRKLMRAIADFTIENIRKYGKLGYDAIAISDDLGTQTTTIFGKNVFLEFYKPLYKEIFAAAHEYGMHAWMHSCGHIVPFLDDLIEAGLDVLHPIQHSLYPGGVSANNPYEVAKNYRDRLTFWAGIDVQYLLPQGSVDEVRKGVRDLMDIFDGPDGGMVVAAGNGIMPETPFENIEAFYDEAYRYGIKKRKGIE